MYTCRDLFYLKPLKKNNKKGIILTSVFLPMAEELDYMIFQGLLQPNPLSGNKISSWSCFLVGFGLLYSRSY